MTLPCGPWASRCSGFSRLGAQAVGAQASVAATHGLGGCSFPALGHRLSCCDVQA